MKYIALLVVLAVIGIGGALYLYQPTLSQESGTPSGDSPKGGEQVACTLDAKICPDGSAVGRVPPNCEFAACPSDAGESVTRSAHVGEVIEARGERIHIDSVKDDSRCPVDVQCIWAGTVHVAVTVDGGLGTSKTILEPNMPYTTEANTITLTGVAPAPVSSQTIAEGDYLLTFTISPR